MIRRILNIFISIALIAGSAINCNPVKSNAAALNIALNKPVIASTQYSATHVPENAVDGKENTMWAAGSTVLEGKINNENFIMVDLLNVYDITNINVRSRRDMSNTSGRSGWKVYGSNSVEFKEYELLGTKQSAGEFLSDLILEFSDAKTYRYIRVSSLNTMHISEIEIFGELSNMGSGKVFSDITGKNLLMAYNLISYLKIMKPSSKSEFGVNMLITRGEAAKIILAAAGKDTITYGIHGFSDIPNGYEYEQNITTCVNMGIIDAGSHFRPKNYITVIEFLTMLQKAMGYKEKIEVSGGYPLGVYTVAKNLGLLKGIDVNTETLSKGSMLIILYNALLSQVASVKSINSSGDVKIQEDNTLLYSAFGLYYYKGIVTENNVTTLRRQAKNSRNTIKVGDSYFTDNTGLLKTLIGQNVCFLVEKDRPHEIIAGWKNQNLGSIYTVDTEDIASVSNASLKVVDKAGNIEFYNYNDASVSVLKNGIAIYDYDLDSFKPLGGKLELIDYDNDGIIDVIHIYEPIIIFANYVSLDNNYIRIGGHNGDIVEVDNFHDIWVYNSKGNLISVDDLTKESLMYVYISEDGSFVTIEYLSSTITATVTEYSDSTVMLNDKTYDLSQYYIQNNTLRSFEIGTKSTFVMDSKNRIILLIDSELKGSEDIIGFIQKVGRKSGLSGNNAIIYNEKGSFETLEFAKKATIDGAVWTDSLIRDVIDNNPEYFIGKFVIYRKNSEGSIIYMDTENYIATTEQDSKMIKSNITIESTAMRVGEGIYQGHFMKLPILLNTTVFVIPVIDGNVISNNSFNKNFKISNAREQFSNGNYINANCSFYCLDKFGYPAFAVKYKEMKVSSGTGVIESKSAPSLVVTEITKKLNSDGEECYGIKGFDIETGASKTLTTLSTLTKAIEVYRIYGDLNNTDIPAEQRPTTSWLNSYGLLNLNSINSSALENYITDILNIKAGDILIYEHNDDIVASLAVAYASKETVNFKTGVIYTMGANYNSRQTSDFKLKGGIPLDMKDNIISFFITEVSNEVVNTAGLTGTLFICEGSKVLKRKPDMISNFITSNSKVVVYSKSGTNRSIIIYN